MLVQVHDVWKKYPGVWALKGVSFDVEKGKVLGVLGDNGAGKSTLMKILAGSEQPDGGEIFVDGAPISFGSPRESRLAGFEMIYQDLALCDDLVIDARFDLLGLALGTGDDVGFDSLTSIPCIGHDLGRFVLGACDLAPIIREKGLRFELCLLSRFELSRDGCLTSLEGLVQRGDRPLPDEVEDDRERDDSCNEFLSNWK